MRNIFGLSSVPGTELLKPSKFPEHWTVFCSYQELLLTTLGTYANDVT